MNQIAERGTDPLEMPEGASPVQEPVKNRRGATRMTCRTDPATRTAGLQQGDSPAELHASIPVRCPAAPRRAVQAGTPLQGLGVGLHCNVVDFPAPLRRRVLTLPRRLSVRRGHRRGVPGQRSTEKSAPSRELPTNRVVAQEQLSIACTIGILPQPFSVHAVKAKLDLNAGRVGLTMAFFEYSGLVTKAPGRGMYLATPMATQLAEAWAKDAELGKAVLRKAWNQTWFTKSARNRLAQGPGLRDGLHARFMMLAGGGATHRRSVDKLMELMILSGLLIQEPDGFVRWFEDATPPFPGGLAQFPARG